MPVLVFLHEGLGSVQMWKDFPDRLASQTGCPALIYSRYGNGRSETLVHPRTARYMHDEADALPDILDAFEIEDAILIGHSDGASIALIYCGETGARVRAAIVLAPHLFVEDHSLRGIHKARELYETAGLRDKLARYHDDPDATFYGWNRIWLDPAFSGWNIRASVKKIGVPVFAVQGASDEYGTFAQIQALHDDVRAPVDVLLLTGCGHSPQRDREHDVIDAASGYIDDLLRSSV